VSYPGVPTSPGFPPLEGVGQQAIRMAQDRLGVLTRGQFPPPVKRLTEEEKEGVLKSAKDEACYLCGALHAAPNTPACPRVATFKLNGDGVLIEGSFWPDSVTDSAIEMNGTGEVITVTHHRHVGWDTSRVMFISDAAEQGGEDEAAEAAG
jgi:hypothetical protein